MAEKDSNREVVKGAFSDLGLSGYHRKGRRDRKHAMKVQLCHAMDQIAIDVKQAIEQYAQDAVTVGLNLEKQGFVLE